MDKGLWTVRDTPRGIMIDSDDFTHDASLIVYGDFRDKKQKIKYAKFIANLLNNAVSKEGKGGKTNRICPMLAVSCQIRKGGMAR